jgi:DMSO/TMAO reductase YedYZ molybdopterin-dependent catalytic subunit
MSVGRRSGDRDVQLFSFGDLFPRSARGGALPPGQRAISSFPRYGVQLARPDPPVPERPLIEVEGLQIEAVELDAASLQNLPRVDLVADFHCVAGWTARGLRWEGVRLRDVYETLVAREPAAAAAITHIRAVGRDGWRAVLVLEDALTDDVLIADRLDGAPLPVEHGGPLRLVSASQYGYKSVKHLCRIELRAGAPAESRRNRLPWNPFAEHPRARVLHEERHRTLPAWAVRWINIRVIHPFPYILGYVGALRTRRAKASAQRIAGKGSRTWMRLPNDAHESRPWRIREIAPDFIVEDVWALPVHGGAKDFQALLEMMASFDPANAKSLPTRFLWRLRDRLGRWFDLGRISAPIGNGRDAAAGKLPIPGTSETSLTGRLPDDLRNTAVDLDFGSLPFAPLYRTDVEFAAELSNRTVHGVMHLAWVDQGEARFQGQMAVYVKPRGWLGKGYMALIKPFRYRVVYPALMRQIERAWKTRVDGELAQTRGSRAVEGPSPRRSEP